MSALPTLAPGERFGPYEVHGLVGSGGMGQVYRARHVTLERDVALKIMSPRITDDPAHLARFLKEARAAALLNHPAIVQIYDIGQALGRYYLVLEFVVGRSLGALLRERRTLPVDQALVLARQAALALAVAHDHGLVHRDVKPENLLLSSTGDLKLIDLGLAKRVDVDAEHVTETSAFAGTPHYMAPEQIRGVRDIDGRADIYGLGATLFHLVCGCTPCPDGPGAAVIAAHLDGALLDPAAVNPALPRELCDVLRRMLARDRRDRYPDARAVERALAAVPVPSGQTETAVIALVPPGTNVALDTLDRIGELLASAIGPFARYLVKQEARASGDLTVICRRLAEHISDARARDRFLARTSALIAGTTLPTFPSTPTPAVPFHREPACFDPHDLERLERALATAIGPVARVLVRRASARAVSWNDLVAELAENLPEHEQRLRFRQSLT